MRQQRVHIRREIGIQVVSSGKTQVMHEDFDVENNQDPQITSKRYLEASDLEKDILSFQKCEDILCGDLRFNVSFGPDQSFRTRTSTQDFFNG